MSWVDEDHADPAEAVFVGGKGGGGDELLVEAAGEALAGEEAEEAEPVGGELVPAGLGAEMEGGGEVGFEKGANVEHGVEEGVRGQGRRKVSRCSATNESSFRWGY